MKPVLFCFYTPAQIISVPFIQRLKPIDFYNEKKLPFLIQAYRTLYKMNHANNIIEKIDIFYSSPLFIKELIGYSNYNFFTSYEKKIEIIEFRLKVLLLYFSEEFNKNNFNIFIKRTLEDQKNIVISNYLDYVGLYLNAALNYAAGPEECILSDYFLNLNSSTQDSIYFSSILKVQNFRRVIDSNLNKIISHPAFFNYKNKTQAKICLLLSENGELNPTIIKQHTQRLLKNICSYNYDFLTQQDIEKIKKSVFKIMDSSQIITDKALECDKVTLFYPHHRNKNNKLSLKEIVKEIRDAEAVILECLKINSVNNGTLSKSSSFIDFGQVINHKIFNILRLTTQALILSHQVFHFCMENWDEFQKISSNEKLAKFINTYNVKIENFNDNIYIENSSFIEKNKINKSKVNHAVIELDEKEKKSDIFSNHILSNINKFEFKKSMCLNNSIIKIHLFNNSN